MIDNNNNKPMFCSRCAQPLCYKQTLMKCKICKQNYKKGKYKEHRNLYHCSYSSRRVGFSSNKTGKYWNSFQIYLD